MPDGKRLWRTESGSLVEDGHPDAVSLAYGVDDALSDDDAALVKPKVEKPAAGHTAKPTGKRSAKQTDAE